METNPNEVVTTVNVNFSEPGGANVLQAQFRDPDGPGGQNPTSTPVTLQNGVTYTVTVEFLNELEDPPEDVTPEIFNERDEHQIFFVGDVVEGPATDVDAADALIRHAYADLDRLGNPVGLQNTIEALRPGFGTFSVGLRHMPLVNEQPQKAAGLVDIVRTGGGFDAMNQETLLPGSWDVVVDLSLTVE